jgi:ABC-type branched-subunit amino acid transport system ATPase component
MVKDNGGDFIFTAKESSHTALYDFIKGAEAFRHDEKVRKGKATDTFRYRWFEAVPLRDGKDAMLVNWIGFEIIDGAFRRKARAGIKANMEFCFTAFPRLAERRRQLAGSMSGGEQQMLALGRVLMLAPRILLIDEPSVGLAPVLVSRTIDAIRALKDQYKLTVLMAEQNFPQALRIADRGYVIVHGGIAFEGRSADELNNNDLIRKFYLGL